MSILSGIAPDDIRLKWACLPKEGGKIMSPDILIVREGDGYRILHGHLHLASELSQANEVVVDAKDEGKVRVIKTRNGYLVGQDGQRWPLLRN
jgi:hypothetical protein